MPRTGLAFYRKQQSLSDFVNERPRSLAALRKAALQATEDIEGRARDLSRLFHDGQKPDVDVRRVVAHARTVMSITEATSIGSASTIQQMEARMGSEVNIVSSERHSFRIVKEYHEKVLEFIPGRLKQQIDDVEQVLNFLQKYCISMYKGSKHKDVETVYHYEMKRREFKRAILMHLVNIQQAGSTYRSPGGTPVKLFGLSSNELARRCDCGDITLLLLFPECCYNIAHAYEGLRKWVKEDELYTDYLKYDIDKLEEDIRTKSKELHLQEKRHSHIAHKIQSTKMMVSELESEINRMTRHEEKLADDISKLENTVKDLEIRAEMEEYEREQLREQMTGSVQTADTADKLDQIAQIISECRYKIPATNKQIRVVRKKIKACSDKKDLVLQLNNDVIIYNQEESKAKAALKSSELSLHKLKECLTDIKSIYQKRNTTDFPKKIFHSIPEKVSKPLEIIPPAGNKVPKKQTDQLQRVSRVVASHISGDWVELYRRLPFYPARGEVIVQEDINTIVTDHHREQDKHRGAVSLQKWRRMNSRASVKQLKLTLGDLGRKDVLQKLEIQAANTKKPAKAKARRRWKRYKQMKGILGKLGTLKHTDNRSIAVTSGLIRKRNQDSGLIFSMLN